MASSNLPPTYAEVMAENTQQMGQGTIGKLLSFCWHCSYWAWLIPPLLFWWTLRHWALESHTIFFFFGRFSGRDHGGSIGSLSTASLLPESVSKCTGPTDAKLRFDGFFGGKGSPSDCSAAKWTEWRSWRFWYCRYHHHACGDSPGNHCGWWMSSLSDWHAGGWLHLLRNLLRDFLLPSRNTVLSGHEESSLLKLWGSVLEGEGLGIRSA